MGDLNTLVQSFSPKREFSYGHCQVDVDGVLVRVAEDSDEDSWILISRDGNNMSHYAIKTEDIVQDPRIVRNARVSTDRDTKAVNEKSKGMVNFLKRDRHETPFGGLVFCLRHDVPIMYAQPFFRLFASHNELSGRYSVINHYYTPDNVSGHGRKIFEEAEKMGLKLYHDLLKKGLAKEMARLVHQYRFRTKFFMTISLRHMMDFLALEGVPTRHQNTEFGDLHHIYKDILKRWTPWAFESFEQYPHRHDFKWLEGEIAHGAMLLEDQPFLDEVDVLDRGQISLLEKYGSESVMLRCLDDFPNPLKGFGHGGMTFRLKIPIHVFRQWVRHRYGNWTELTVDFDRVAREKDFYMPDRFRVQEGKPGHYIYKDIEDDERNEYFRRIFRVYQDKCIDWYWQLREMQYDKEISALVLPYSFYMPAVWTVPVESLFNFFSLRCDSHAQFEIRQYANRIWPMFKKFFPISAKIFAEHLKFGDGQIFHERG
jgi:thymidylate synthase (FAD)